MNQPTTATEPGLLERKTILLALEPSSLNELVIPPLIEAGMEVKIAASLEDAIQRLTLSAPEFLLLAEGFGTRQLHLNPMLNFIARLPAPSRRTLFVAWIGASVKTRDYLTAFSLSVNLVIHPDYLMDTVRLLTESRQEYLDLFGVYLQIRRQPLTL
jgi:hypothetical protein